MDNNTLLGAVLVVAGLGDIGIGVVIGWRLKTVARLALIGGGSVLFVAGLLLSLGLFKLV